MEGSGQERGGNGWWEQFGLGEMLKTMARAVEPSKIVMALAGVLLIAVWGILLDSVWLAFDHGVAPNAIALDVMGIAPETPAAPDLGIEENSDSSAGAQHQDGIFAAFWQYESRCIWNVIASVRHGVFVGSMNVYARDELAPLTQMDAVSLAMGNIMPHRASIAGDVLFNQPRGVLTNLVLMIKGEWWLVKNHWFFALLLFPFALIVKCIVGGAICRISALQIGREMHLGISDAFSYSTARLGRWIGAILLPFIFLIGISILLWVGGLLMSVPWIGDILGGLFFPIALMGGLAIALVAAGILLGAGFLWPVIAVEGEDPFNAVSRSFEFVFQRPVKTVFYWCILLVLGCISFVVARLFVWFALAATHTVVGAGTDLVTSRGSDGAMSKLDTLWSFPTLDVFLTRPDSMQLGFFESISAWLISLWVLIFGGLVWAYLYSFFFTGATTAMMLVRRDLWGNRLDDVEVDAMTGPFGLAETSSEVSNKEDESSKSTGKGEA